MAKSFKKLKDLANMMGVKVEEVSDGYEAWSPKGKVFAANGAHCLVSVFEYEPHGWPNPAKLIKGTKGETRDDMWERLAMGLTVCEVEQCDSCAKAE